MSFFAKDLKIYALKEDEWEGEDPEPARVGERQVYFEEFIQTPVFSMELLRPGNRIAGPAIVESPATTLLLHPRQMASVDRSRNLLLQVT